MLGYDLWQRKYRGDPNVAGQTIKLNDIAYTIIGIAPQRAARRYSTEPHA